MTSRHPARPGAPGAAYLFAGAAILLAAAVFIAIWRGRFEPERAVPAASSRPTDPPAPAATSAPARAKLPTRGPKTAADAIVGAPRGSVEPTLGGTYRPPEILEGSEPAFRVSAFDGVYRTRRFARFGVRPDQARLFVDGRYVGIADDWDDWGGGRTLEFSREGSHRVRLELPGYRTLRLEIVASPGAKEETVEIGDSLVRESRVEYPKIPKVDDRTVGPVEFAVDPANAQVAEGEKVFGRASSYGPGSPLRLSGPMVHDLVISAPGRRPKTVRILVAGNAGRDRAKVKGELKKE